MLSNDVPIIVRYWIKKIERIKWIKLFCEKNWLYEFLLNMQKIIFVVLSKKNLFFVSEKKLHC